MGRISYLLAIAAMTALLAGCETLKSTISGPFIGMEKDAQNIAMASGKVLDGALNDTEDEKNQGTLRRVDNWMQKNWW